MLSIIIPTLNVGADFGKLLDALDAQTYKAEEILIIDSSSNDSTAKIAQNRSCKVIKMNRTNFDHGATRNLGVARTDNTQKANIDVIFEEYKSEIQNPKF